MERPDENTAWLNFALTGSVEDYLIYCERKHSDLTGDAENENRDKGTCFDGTERRRSG